MLGPLFEIPGWLALLLFAVMLIGLVFGLVASYYSFKGVYLLLTSRTTGKLRRKAAFACIVISALFLLALIAEGYVGSVAIVPYVLGFPFGFCAGTVAYLFVIAGTGTLPGWLVNSILPLLFAVNIVLNYTGYIGILYRQKAESDQS